MFSFNLSGAGQSKPFFGSGDGFHLWHLPNINVCKKFISFS